LPGNENPRLTAQETYISSIDSPVGSQTVLWHTFCSRTKAEIGWFDSQITEKGEREKHTIRLGGPQDGEKGRG
jgi:hypothetical protein